MTQPRVIIRKSPAGGGFDITVDPPARWADHSATRPTHRDAARYAASLRVVHRWPVVDESGGENGEA